MYVALSLPFLIAYGLAWNRVRGFLALTHQPDFRPLFPHDPIYAFAHWLDARNVTETQFFSYTLIAGLVLTALGFFYDMLLKGRGFGAFGNAGLLLTGNMGALWGWSVWAPLVYGNSIPAVVLVSAVGGGVLLLLAAQLRHLVSVKLDDLASGATGQAVLKTSRARTAEDVVGYRAGKSACAPRARRERR